MTLCASLPCQIFFACCFYALGPVRHKQAGLLLNDLQDSCVKLISATEVSEMFWDF